MAITQCTVTGTIRNALGSGVPGAVIKVNSVRPFIHPTDNSLVVDYEVSTAADNNGDFSISLIETATPAVSLTLAIVYPAGSSTGNHRKEYTVIIPNTASATLSSLIGSQV